MLNIYANMRKHKDACETVLRKLTFVTCAYVVAETVSKAKHGTSS